MVPTIPCLAGEGGDISDHLRVALAAIIPRREGRGRADGRRDFWFVNLH